MLRLTTLLGLGSFYSAEGLSAGVFAARTGRHLGGNCSRTWCGSRQLLNEHSRMETATCLRISNRHPHVSRSPPPCMTAGGEGDPETTTAAPRTKRVRRRRKDASLIDTPGEKVEGNSASRVPLDQQLLEQPTVIAPEAEATRAAVMEASTATPEEEILRTPASPAIQESQVYVGGTKGTKVRVDASDDDISEKLTSAMSAASGAAGDAAKSTIDAVMSTIGKGNDASESDLANGRQQASTTPTKLVDMEDLGADIERYRKRESGQRLDSGGEESLSSGAKDVISTIITIDFFVVIAFLVWFISGVVSSYGFSNSFLLDQFNDKWSSVVQPALGVLMGGTIAGGVLSKLGESGDGDREVKR